MEIEMLARVAEVKADRVHLELGIVGYERPVPFDIHPDNRQAFMDAKRRGERVMVRIEVPTTDAQNREAAREMAADMSGEIEG